MEHKQIKAFTIDVFPLYRVIQKTLKDHESRISDTYTCKICANQEVQSKDITRHVFSGHNNTQSRIRRLTVKSNDGSHFTCFCGFTVLSVYVDQFISHFLDCIGFEKLPKPIEKSLKQFRAEPVYALCQAEQITCETATEEQQEPQPSTSQAQMTPEQFADMPTYLDDIPPQEECVRTVEESLNEPNITDEHLSQVFGISPSNNSIRIVSNKHRLRMNLRNHVNRYLHEHVSPNDELECMHCGNLINSLQYIQHAIAEHIDVENYGAPALPCPCCKTYVSRLIYATGYHYACMLCHIAECLLAKTNAPRGTHYKDFVVTFNQICLSSASHSPYVVNKLYPGYEHDTDQYFSFDELVHSTRPDQNDSTEMGEDTVRKMFNLGKASLYEEFNNFLRIDSDKRVPHFNGECKVCREDMMEMLFRMRYDRPGVATEVFLTRDQFRERYPGILPRFITSRETPLTEPIEGLSGLKLFMLEVASRLPNRQYSQIPEEEREDFLCVTHTYIYRGKANAIFNWLDRNAHRVFVFPNSTLCWDEKKFDSVTDPMDLTNTHRHVILVFDKYSTYREFSNQEFNFDPPFQTVASQMIRAGRARQFRVQIVGKVSKLITSPQHLFGATIYVSRFKMPNNPNLRSLRARNPGNNLIEAENYDEDNHDEGALELLNEYDRYQSGAYMDVYNEDDNLESKALKHCYNSTTSDHHEMTCLMSRHAKIISYSLYKDGLTDWYIRARIYNEVLWLHQASNLKTFAQPPIPHENEIAWPVRSDLSNIYIPLNIAKSVLPGYVSNHPVEILPDQPQYKESRDMLRSFGGVLFDASPLFVYGEHEICYIRLSLNCSKRLVNYIQTIATRAKEYSGMVMFNSAASVAIIEQKKMLGKYKLVLENYQKREAEIYNKRIQHITQIFNLTCMIDFATKELSKVVNSRFSSKDRQLQALLGTCKKIVSFLSTSNRLSTDQMNTISRETLDHAKALYNAVREGSMADIETELISRHLIGQLED
nr:MAG: hypothetical protein [Apis mellifra filamentous-like virus]